MWAITAIEHPAVRDVREDCAECLALAPQAARTARATGSIGATYREEGRNHITGFLEGHSATVTRIMWPL